MPPNPRLFRRWTLLAAGVTVACGIVLLISTRAILVWLPADDVLRPIAFPARQLGWTCILLAALPARGVYPKAFFALGLSLLTTVLILGLAEMSSRRLGWDWKRQESTWRQLPPFTREPRTPTGTVFFRREGPEVWNGAVLRTSLIRRGRPVPPVYQAEPVIEVRYDRWGFREEPGQVDWEIAIAGDSFTELGCLPHAQLFTTLLARKSGLRVRNLGVSGTGPYTQLHYLQEFGRSTSLRQIGIVFFEGNDLEDLTAELAALETFRSTGERPHREFDRQTSMLGAVADAWRRWRPASSPSPEIPLVHTFLSSTGAIPVHLTEVPLSRRLIPEGTASRLDGFLEAYRDLSRTLKVSAWLAYMPCKARVLHPRLDPTSPLPAGREPWWPVDLPHQVAEACRRHDILFIDLTPALLAAAKDRGELVFNPLWEFHLNALGSECVANELAHRLK